MVLGLLGEISALWKPEIGPRL